jgi:hypothetical protein
MDLFIYNGRYQQTEYLINPSVAMDSGGLKCFVLNLFVGILPFEVLNLTLGKDAVFNETPMKSQ